MTALQSLDLLGEPPWSSALEVQPSAQTDTVRLVAVLTPVIGPSGDAGCMHRTPAPQHGRSWVTHTRHAQAHVLTHARTHACTGHAPGNADVRDEFENGVTTTLCTGMRRH